MDSNKAKSVLRKLRLILKTLPLDDKIIGLALNDDNFLDFEDGLQYFSAIEETQSFLPDKKDFCEFQKDLKTQRV
ncbi:MAG: hypothetical protein RG741_11045 [Bacteroidales bacterium]|nr:hypothetical protein [Bacteroidales bacterium]